MSGFHHRAVQRVTSRFLIREGGVPVGVLSEGLLQGLLGLCHALYWHHWTMHWQTKGGPFYGDHLLFERLYSGMVSEIDTVAEKLVQMHGSQAVAVELIYPVTGTWLSRWLSETDPVVRSERAERDFQQAIRSIYDDLKESGELSLGLDDFLMSTANAHETNLYLLQQRLGGQSRVASSIVPPHGYKYLRDDANGHPVFIKGELGKKPYWIVSRWGAEWALHKYDNGWHRLDEPFAHYRTPQDAANDTGAWRHAAKYASYNQQLWVHGHDARLMDMKVGRLASGAPSAESEFFDAPRKRETAEFAESGALTNIPNVSSHAKYDNGRPKAEKHKLDLTPLTPSEVVGVTPGSGEFSTLSRYVVQTETPTDRGVPQSHDEIPKHPVRHHGRTLRLSHS